MKTKFIEAMHVNGTGNWGKFMVARFDDEEWARDSEIMKEELSQRPELTAKFPRLKFSTKLLNTRGWSRRAILVFDLETGEGAMFLPGGLPSADLEKHKIWVCPLFQPFLEWLYKQDLTDLDKLPSKVEFTHDEADFNMVGYRRPGPEQEPKKK